MSAGRIKDNQKTENGSGVYHSLKVNVPDHWQVIPLEEVLDDIIGGGTPSKANPEYWVGSIPWLTVKDMRTRRPEDAIDHISKDAVRDSATNIIPADTVIIATRIGLGKVIRVPYGAAINQDLKALIAKPELEKGYLEYWILSIAEYLESIGSGTTVKGIRLEQLRSLPFPLAPLNEQKRIVAEIEKQFSRLDEAVANLKRVKANLKRYKAAVLKAAVEGKLTEDWRKQHPNVEPASKLLERILAERRARWHGNGKYQESSRSDTSDLPKLPNGWTWTPLEAISEAIGGFAFESKKFTSTGFQVIKMANIRMGRIDVTQKPCFIQDVEADVAAKYSLIDGDLVVTLTGTRKKQDYGYVAVVKNPKRLLLNQRIARLRPADGVLSQFLELTLQSEDYRNRFFAHETGNVGQGNVGMEAVTKVPITLAPFAEQQHIVAEVERRLSGIKALVSAVEANLTRADRLRQSILSQAFSGGLFLERSTNNGFTKSVSNNY